MFVDATSANALLPQSQALSHDRLVQDTFSAVLEAAGRNGYASSGERTESEAQSAENVQAAWSTWFDSERSGRYAMASRPEELKQEYGQLLARALTEGGYEQPLEFLQSLTKDELEVVKSVNWLGDSIDVGSLTEEGALNLLLPGAAQVDLNHDGLTQTGKAYGMRFPDSNTPIEVADAWEEATAGLSDEEKMVFQLEMMLPLLTANIVLDENGSYSHHYEPGDVGFRNPLAEAGYSYQQAIQDRLENLEFVKALIPQARYERQADFWQKFSELLGEKGSR